MWNRSVLFFCAILFLSLISFFPAIKESTSQIAIAPQNAISQPPNIEAKSALVIDLASGKQIFKKNPSAVLPLASLTKIITALVVMDLASINEMVEISPEAIATEGQSPIAPFQKISVRDLLILTLNESSNDAAIALVEHSAQKSNVPFDSAERWIIPLMYKKMFSLGLQSFVFHNTTGLDVSKTLSGAYGSAEDMLRLAQKIYRHKIWEFGKEESITLSDGVKYDIKATNKINGSISQLHGAKTGFTDIAGGNLLILAEAPIGRPIGIVVMSSSENGRFSDAKILLEWAMEKSKISDFMIQ